MSGLRQEKDLLGTSSSLLAKWSTGPSSLLSSTSAFSLGSATKTDDDAKKRKPAEVPSGALGEKKSKMGGSSLLTGGSLTGGLALTSSLSKGLLSSGSLLGPSKLSAHSGLSFSSGLSHKLESPLSKLRLEEGGCAPLSHLSGGLSHGGSGSTAKPSRGISTDAKITEKPLRRQRSPMRARKTREVDEGRSKLGKSRTKKMKMEGKVVTPGARACERMAMPEYDLRTDEVMDEPMELVTFIPPDKDVDLMGDVSSSLQDVEGLKNGLINAVSASLLCSPNFRDPHDNARRQLITITEKVVIYDAEFVLKVALYCRRELNIRTTTNFLLALASNRSECRPFIRKYYVASIMLPSDWIEVAEVYQAFKDKNLNFGSLPASLRKVMVTKFADFDKYQLAKYNKDKSGKKKKKDKRKANDSAASGRGGMRGGMRGRGRGRGGARGGMMSAGSKRKGDVSDSSSDDDDDDDEDEDGGIKRQVSGVEYDEEKVSGVEYDEEKVSGVEYDEESETDEERQLKTFTLKQLIRKLHITEPVDHVMSLIGKKYPLTPEEFYQRRLPGMWEEERAGKRMKLPVPETWETQVSLKGNKAQTWQDLLDHKKLPFMAMLRNLRNLIKAGISDKHHTSVIRRLTDQRQVANSKQFPFRFFSAYEVLHDLEKEYHKSQEELVEAAVETSSRPMAVARGRGRKRGGAGGKDDWWKKKLEKKKQGKGQPKETPYDERIIQRYRKALDSAVKIATVHNVQPIRGRTIILCSLSDRMKVPCQAAKKGLGKPRTVAEVSLLLALMCKYSCEESELVVYDGTSYCTVEVEKGTILDNMERVLNTNFAAASARQPGNSWDEQERKKMVCDFPYWILGEKLRDRVQIDNLVILDYELAPTDSLGSVIGHFLRPYRRLVNPNLLYVSICAAAAGCKFNTDIRAEHENDVYISGFSDAILRFIAERGSGGQLLHVENIDKAYNLLTPTPFGLDAVDKAASAAISPEKPLAIPSLVPRWRTARVFISSTFRDMHGERDLLTRFVFPELRALGRQHFINVFEVDLRWGVNEETSNTNRTLELCLQELSRCQLFVGLLGNRYGWVPERYQLPDAPEFDCVRQYPPGSSVTELEMHFGALKNTKESRGKAFFFIRNDSFEKDIPVGFKSDFVADNEDHRARLDKLKNRVRTSGLEVFDRYPCEWGGVVDSKPMVAGLQEFGQRALNNLWLAVQHLYPDEDAVLDEDTHIMRLHRAFVDSRQGQFVGRRALVKQCLNKLAATGSGLVGLVGKAGSGKSSLMASVIHEYVESRHCASGSRVLVHIVGAAPGSSSLAATLLRLSHELKRTFGLSVPIPEDYKNLVMTFGSLLQEAGSMCSSASPLVVFVDGMYLMDSTHQPCSLAWLPHPLPPNVVVVVSAVEGDPCHLSLARLKAEVVTVGALDMFDKAEVVRQTLAVHRKTLDETPFNNQLKFLMMKKEAHNPLFLKMACEELRVFGVFESVTSKLKSMSHTTQQLLQEILQRLETDHGVDVVSTTLSLLICARDGLLAEELHELLAWHAGLTANCNKIQPLDMVNQAFPQSSALPPVVFAFLQRSVQSFVNPLSSDSGNVRLTLAHPDIGVAVRHRYLRGAAAEKELQLHRLLAGYFMRQADPKTDKSWQGRNPRAFSELPYHLSCAGCFKDLAEVLCSLRFIYSKCLVGHATQLMDDFVAKGCGNKALEKEQAKFLATPRLQEYQTFVSCNLHILAAHPGLTWQQASNSQEGSAVCQEVRELREAQLIRESGCVDWNNKPDTPDPCYLHLDNLSQPATCVAVSSDSTYFATGGLDCLVRLFDMATGKEVRFFQGHSDSITDVCFVSTTVLCSASQDKTLSLWDVEQGHRIALLKGHNRKVNACAADRSGKLLASAGWDTMVRVWNAGSGEQICFFNLECPVNDVKFHPEGQLIVTANWDATIKIFDVLHRSRKAILRGHMSSVRAVAYSSDGCHIASAALDGDVKIWSATKGVQVGNIRGHGGPINKLTFSPSGQELITASDDHKIKVWSGELGVPLHVIGSEDNGAATTVSLSPDGTTVAVGYHSGYVRVFDVGTGVLMWETKPHTMAVRAVVYSSDNSYILSGSDDTKVHILEASHGTKVSTLEGHSQAVLSIAVHRKAVATTSEDCTCCLFPPIKTAKTKKSSKPVATLRGHTGPVGGCSFGPAAQKLVTSSRDMSVCIWDVSVCLLDPDPAPEVTLDQCHNDWVNACQWSNTADFIVTASNDFNLKVWDAKTKEEKFRLQGHTSNVNTMAYRSGCVVSGSSDGQVKVWSHRGTEITTLYGHTQRVNGCDVYIKCSSTDGCGVGEGDEDTAEDAGKSWADAVEEAELQGEEQEGETKTKTSAKKSKAQNIQDVLVASCSDDGTVRLWRPLQANTLASLTGHSDRVLAVAADKDGHVASVGLDRSLRLWSPRLVSQADITGQHEVEVTSIAPALDGNWALSADRSGVVNIWQNKGNTFSCVFSLKAHEKSVGSACFVNKSSSRFVTASDDMTFAVWEMVPKKEGLIVRKKKELGAHAPITSLTWDPSLMPGSTETFVIGTSWDGAVFYKNLDNGAIVSEPVCKMQGPKGSRPVYKDWPLSVRVSAGRLLLTTTDGRMGVWTCLSEKSQVSLREERTDTIPTEKADGQLANWVSMATAGSRDRCYTGDSSGHLTCVTADGTQKQLKVHSQGITGVLAGRHIFTASQDCTVKVWAEDFTQLGQFYCQAPVTSVCSVGTSSSDVTHIMAGDQLGNVYLLTWRYQFTH